MLKIMVKELLDPLSSVQKEQKEEIEYKVLNSEYLTGKDVILAMSSVIDAKDAGYQILDKIDLKGREITQIDQFKSNVKTRSEKMALISNGRNTIQLLDWNEQTTIVRHDPVIRIIGPDAFSIADTFCTNMLKTLKETLFESFKVEPTIIKDIAGLTGKTEKELDSTVTRIADSFKIMLEDAFAYGKGTEPVKEEVKEKEVDDIL